MDGKVAAARMDGESVAKRGPEASRTCRLPSGIAGRPRRPRGRRVRALVIAIGSGGRAKASMSGSGSVIRFAATTRGDRKEWQDGSGRVAAAKRSEPVPDPGRGKVIESAARMRQPGGATLRCPMDGRTEATGNSDA